MREEEEKVSGGRIDKPTAAAIRQIVREELERALGRRTKRAADLLPCGHPKSSLVRQRFGQLPYCEICKRATIR